MQSIKTLFLTIIISSFCLINVQGQTTIKTYQKEWKAVEQLIEKQLVKSALAEVKKIYAMAKKDKQEAQVIKSVAVMVSLQNNDDGIEPPFNIKEIEEELKTSKEPATSLWYSLLAEEYNAYYRANSWRFSRRTTTVDFKKDDVATWTNDDFIKKITELFLLSVKNESILQQTRLEPFDAIIYKGNVRHLRPTLYDLLAHHALDFFSINQRMAAKPAYAFEIDMASAFDPAADFITRKYSSRDSSSRLLHSLHLYQKLIALHLKDAKHDALIDVDLLRLEFVRNNSRHPDKDQLYLAAINHVANQFGNLPAAAEAWYRVAAYYEQKAKTYSPFADTTHRYARIKAKEILEKIEVQKDSSEGKIHAQNLLKEILSPTLAFSVERVNVPAQPFRSLVRYKNISTLYLRIIKADDDIKRNLEQNTADNWKKIIAEKAEKTWQQSLPATNDLQSHKVEIKIDALPVGEYVLLAGSDKDFQNSSTVLGARLFYVSNISHINNGQFYYILNRDNGQPMQGANVTIWERKYDYKTSRYTNSKFDSYTTDRNGHFSINLPKNRAYGGYNWQIEIKSGSDRLFITDQTDDYYYRNPGTSTTEDNIRSAFLFTDRSLYRPGQMVYFKAIIFDRNRAQNTNNTAKNYPVKIFLRDANYQDVDSLDLRTNEFGSVNGVFNLPQTGLNGLFTIYVKKENGEAYFRVEDYKRPKFLVEFEPLKGTYKVNDSVRVSGIAKAYAGNNIDGASVSYRVVRQPRFLYPWLFSRYWLPQSSPMEIAFGETKTDKDGRFVVTFKAIPDLAIDKKLDPVFDYKIYAVVTDINGETRSADKTVPASYKALILKTAIPARISSDSLATFFIRTENINGEFEPSTIKLTFSKLQEEKRLIRNRLWDRPDQFVMSKQEYIQHFPYDEYDNESSPESWPVIEKVLEQSDSARSNGQWKMGNKKLAPGFYQVQVLTHDKNGEEIKDIWIIEVYDEKNPLTRPQYLWTEAANPAEPGEKATVKLGSSANNVFVVQTVDKRKYEEQNLNPSYTHFAINNQVVPITFTPTEQDRGGFGATWIFVKHNRVHLYRQTIVVPWTNKDLNIEYASFRDKTLPGSQEKWKLRITGAKKEKVAAEMLASMYDASLDQFYPHNWNKPAIWPEYNMFINWTSHSNFSYVDAIMRYFYDRVHKAVLKEYDRLFISLENEDYYHYFRSDRSGPSLMRLPKPVYSEEVVVQTSKRNTFADGRTANAPESLAQTDSAAPPTEMDEEEKTQEPEELPQIRKNFNETAFFFPQLYTDSSGAIEFSFTIPESLTKWKFLALSHTKEGALGYSTQEIITQKQLMVQPNAPRFVREGDKIEFSSKIVNLTDKEMTGQVELLLFDATTNQSVDGWFKNMMPNQYFTVGAGQSEAVRFPIEIPYLFDRALTWRIVARTTNTNLSDGEENMLPVLTNRMLVTETMPLNVRGTGTRNFNFEKLLNSGSSETLKHHKLTIEYTSNPAWYVVQALPYLMEYPYDCAEQTWNRYYANSLASFIANSSPRIRAVFEKWKTLDTTALLSNLQKNEELKALLLEETPWVLQAKSETEQKKNIALLFDLIKMNRELTASFEKLKQMQSPNGGFVWFKGGPDDRYMTQYIVTGIGHLKQLNAFADDGQQSRLQQILDQALPYLDRKIKEDYDQLVKNKADLKTYVPYYTIVQYFYMRSFFKNAKLPAATQKAYDYFKSRIQATWNKQNKYMQGMSALALHRMGDVKTPKDIINALKETSIQNEELGMYWADKQRSWWWYEAPIERQALLIEVFQEITKDTKIVDDLKTWLLKNKQTNNWGTTKASAEACYALLLQGTNWIKEDPIVNIKLGSTVVRSDENKQEAGTGYFKTIVPGASVQPNMGNISVSVTPTTGSTTSTSWGSVYWQYFEDLDKITTAATPLKLVKKLFIERNTDRGPVLTPLNEGDIIKLGDKIKVRIELRVDRDMEYVHMKDMRASSFEPVNVLSTYKWQDGLGYYETTRDASTNFFFNYLRKGTYVFEYPMYATVEGNFSNGITSIQCMYAPEFTAHSEGIRVNVED